VQYNQELLQAQAAEIKRLFGTIAQLATRAEDLSVRNAKATMPVPAAMKPAAPKSVAPKSGCVSATGARAGGEAVAIEQWWFQQDSDLQPTIL
jgi:hypothetical protein